MKKHALLLALTLGLAHAQPLRTQLPPDTHAYFYTEDLLQWLALGEHQAASLAPVVEQVKSALANDGLRNLPPPVNALPTQAFAKHGRAFEMAVFGDAMHTLLSFALPDEQSALDLAQALAKQPLKIEKTKNGNSRLVAQKGKSKACFGWDGAHLLVMESCAHQSALRSNDGLPAPSEGSELYLFNVNNQWFDLKDKDTKALAQALELDKVHALHLRYQPQAKRLQLTLEHQSQPLKALLSAQAHADFVTLPEVQSALAFPMPSAQATLQLAPALMFLAEQELKKVKSPVNIYQWLDALAGQWAWVNEAGHEVLLWRGDGAKFDEVMGKLADKGWVQQSALSDGITQVSYLKQTDKPELLMAASLLPTDFYYRDRNGVREFATLPQILHDRQNANQALAQFGAKNQSALWYGTQIPHLEKSQYYLKIKWLKYLAERTGTKFDWATLPSASAQNFAPQSPLLFQLYDDAHGANLEIQLAHGAFDLGVWLQEQSAYGGVAGMGILAAIALPAYQDYVSKSQLTQTVYELRANPKQTPRHASEVRVENGVTIARIGKNANRDLHGVEIRITADKKCTVRGAKKAVVPKECSAQ